MKQLILKKGKESSVLRQHPWVFSGAILNYESIKNDGELVQLLDYDGNHLAIGHFQNHGSIAFRILSFDHINIDPIFWENRLRNAYNLRFSAGVINKSTNCFRLVHGEGDYLPGLIIDIYNNNAVIQAHSMGMHLQAEEIASALDTVFNNSLDTIYYKSKKTLPTRQSVPEDKWLKGDKNHTIAHEHNLKFKIDWVGGQKTGFFLDQRENRKLLGTLVNPEMEILNTFCYSGGFSVYALKMGAKKVTSVDASDSAIHLTEENIVLNDLNSLNHNAIVSDTIQFLRQTSEYDIIVVDPPAFAKSIKSRHNALNGYKRLNALAISKIKPGGKMLTFSCSQAVSIQDFEGAIRAAGIETARPIRIVKRLQQGQDHPVSLQHPEGEYLKGFLLQID